jgi:hypothetical protein
METDTNTAAVTEAPETPQTLVRKTRRRRAPRKPCPTISAAMKAKWQEPQYREKQAAWAAKRRADPRKLWSRRGVYDGYTRATARIAKEEARRWAHEMIIKLRRAGILSGRPEDVPPLLPLGDDLLATPRQPSPA